MKIRNGFVSNSSSSSYIVAIPQNYILTELEKENIKRVISEKKEFFQEENINSFLEEKMNEALSFLKKDGFLYWEDDECDEDKKPMIIVAKNILETLHDKIIIAEIMDGPYCFLNIMATKQIEKGLKLVEEYFVKNKNL